MIRYALPDLTGHLPCNLAFAKLQRTAPELFFDDVSISSIYGNFPGCIMNGGRLCSGNPYTYDQIMDIMDRITAEGLTLRLTFTNMLLRPEHFDNQYSNMILKAAKEHNAQIIVNSDELANYISDRYHLSLILSTTRALSGVEELNNMLDRYDMVVLDYNHNKDDAFLKQVKDPSRLEVMPNELCEPGCPNRQFHYEHLSRCQLDGEPLPFTCPQTREKSGFTARTDSSPTLLGNEDIRHLNSSYGISHFKIVGRVESWTTTMESLLYYLIRLQYRSVVYKAIKKDVFGK